MRRSVVYAAIVAISSLLVFLTVKNGAFARSGEDTSTKAQAPVNAISVLSIVENVSITVVLQSLYGQLDFLSDLARLNFSIEIDVI